MKNTLKVTTPGDREIVLSRVFDAPRELVYETMARPDLLQRWLTGPPGWTMTVSQNDLRVGGTFRHVWRSNDGTEMAMTGIYREVVPPERIVRTESFTFGCESQKGEQLATLVLTEHAAKRTSRSPCSIRRRKPVTPPSPPAWNTAWPPATTIWRNCWQRQLDPAQSKWSISQLMSRFQKRKRVPCFGTPKHAFEYESMAPIIQTWSLFVKWTTKPGFRSPRSFGIRARGCSCPAAVRPGTAAH